MLPSFAEELRKERKKSTKNDAAIRLASAIHEVSSYKSLSSIYAIACIVITQREYR